MFYYLHLTRPPPEQADVSQPLLITPNIANDLRTECPVPDASGIEIYYAWVKCIEHVSVGAEGAKRRALGPMTRPQKLMTWMGNLYKEVQVFPPKEALQTPGGRWQLLLLCTHPPRSGKYITSIDFSDENFGAPIFPILSSPVLLTTGGRNAKGFGREAEKKQVRNERVFKLPSSLWGTTASKVGPLRVTEYLSYDLDKKVWDSGVGLAHWLVQVSCMIRPMACKDDSASDWDSDIPSIVKNLMQRKGSTILELGAGTGLVSIVLSCLLSHSPEQPQSTIIATDLPSAMEILETNLSDNGHCYPSVLAKAAVLDWEDEKLPPEVEDGVDFIVMADVTYNTASFPSLIRTLSRLSLLRRDPSRPTEVLLAYKERDPDERRLWGMMREIGLHLDEVGRVPGAGGMPVEIYAGIIN